MSRLAIFQNALRDSIGRPTTTAKDNHPEALTVSGWRRNPACAGTDAGTDFAFESINDDRSAAFVSYFSTR